MDIFGINPTEIAMAVILAFGVWVHVTVLRMLWNRPGVTEIKLAWSAAIICMPFLGAFLYWWFVIEARVEK